MVKTALHINAIALSPWHMYRAFFPHAESADEHRVCGSVQHIAHRSCRTTKDGVSVLPVMGNELIREGPACKPQELSLRFLRSLALHLLPGSWLAGDVPRPRDES